MTNAVPEGCSRGGFREKDMQGVYALNKGWLFHLGECSGGYKGLDDKTGSRSRCRTIGRWAALSARSMPAARGTCLAAWAGTGGISGCPGEEGDRLFVSFGGVYKHARVWFNSNYLGMRAYGYSAYP